MNQILLSPPPPSIIEYHQQQQTQRQESQQHVHLHIAGFYNIEGFWNGQLEEQLISTWRLGVCLFGGSYH